MVQAAMAAEKARRESMGLGNTNVRPVIYKKIVYEGRHMYINLSEVHSVLLEDVAYVNMKYGQRYELGLDEARDLIKELDYMALAQ